MLEMITGRSVIIALIPGMSLSLVVIHIKTYLCTPSVSLCSQLTKLGSVSTSLRGMLVSSVGPPGEISTVAPSKSLYNTLHSTRIPVLLTPPLSLSLMVRYPRTGHVHQPPAVILGDSGWNMQSAHSPTLSQPQVIPVHQIWRDKEIIFLWVHKKIVIDSKIETFVFSSPKLSCPTHQNWGIVPQKFQLGYYTLLPALLVLTLQFSTSLSFPPSSCGPQWELCTLSTRRRSYFDPGISAGERADNEQNAAVLVSGEWKNRISRKIWVL